MMFFVGGRWIMEILTFARPTLRPPVVYCRCASPPLDKMNTTLPGEERQPFF